MPDNVTSVLEVSRRLEDASDTQIEKALDLANFMLDTTLAIISQVRDDRYTIEHFCAPPGALSKGQEFRLGNTYCALTLEAQDVVSIADMEHSSHSGHPCYNSFGLETYIGVPLKVNGEVYGTLNFSDPGKRNADWKENERALVRLLGALVGQMIERQQTQARLRELTESLDAANQTLHESNLHLRTFAGSLSHDLKQPLRTLTSFTELLERSAHDKLSEQDRKYLKFMGEATERLQGLTSGLLLYLKLGVCEEPEPVSLDDVISGVQSDLASSLANSKAELEISPLPKVSGVKWQLSLVFQNLLSNALKFARPGIPPKISVWAEPLHEGLLIHLEDNGIGFNEEFASHMFHIFRRLHGPQEHPGSGLGLAIVDRVMRFHTGSASAISPNEQGSRFTLWFPQSRCL